ncbi:hypothetical protein D5H75_01175 [Bailinhaonella thermotolerans]|uniref:Uncharacterized protein n=2 Tax=Bailinhaonella thermotolerans TaxID=1070861 RepID=A0A3A4BB71_9ACTN|nr:hypothetical protein D5H75_01175 [Bailinhaonella thermotolerans]
MAAPVREIARAVQLVEAGGTVVVLDSGEYQDFRVDKSLSVIAEGVHAEVLGTSGFYEGAIYVDAGAAGVVALRGLSVRGTGAGASKGVKVSSGRVRIERCTISGFGSRPDGAPTAGITVYRGTVTVVDTVLRDNRAAIEASAQAGEVTRVSLERCRLHGDGGNNTNGIQVNASTRMAVSDSLVTDYGIGVYLRGYTGSPRAMLTLTGTTVANNRIGVYSDKDAQVVIARSTVTLNDSGLVTLNGGVIYTAGDNAVLGNFTTDIGAGTVYAKPDLSI